MVRAALTLWSLLAVAGCARLVTPSDLRPAPHPLLELAPGRYSAATATATPLHPREVPQRPTLADRAPSDPASEDPTPGPPAPDELAPSEPAPSEPVSGASKRSPGAQAGPRPLLPAPAGRPQRAAGLAPPPPSPRTVALPAPARPRPARPAPEPAPSAPPPPARRPALAGITPAGARPAAPASPATVRGPAPLLPAPSRVDDPRVLAARGKARRQLEQLAGKRTLSGRPLTDLDLVRRSLAGTGASAPRAARLDDLWEHSLPQRRAAEPGDLVFFTPAPSVPSVCVIRQRLRDGVLEAGCLSRGAVRWIRLTPGQPHTRRRDGRILNTFLRTKQPEDAPGTRYLAGQLLWQIRTPFR